MFTIGASYPGAASAMASAHATPPASRHQPYAQHCNGTTFSKSTLTSDVPDSGIETYTPAASPISVVASSQNPLAEVMQQPEHYHSWSTEQGQKPEPGALRTISLPPNATESSTTGKGVAPSGRHGTVVNCAPLDKADEDNVSAGSIRSDSTTNPATIQACVVASTSGIGRHPSSSEVEQPRTPSPTTSSTSSASRHSHGPNSTHTFPSPLPSGIISGGTPFDDSASVDSPDTTSTSTTLRSASPPSDGAESERLNNLFCWPRPRGRGTPDSPVAVGWTKHTSEGLSRSNQTRGSPERTPRNVGRVVPPANITARPDTRGSNLRAVPNGSSQSNRPPQSHNSNRTEKDFQMDDGHGAGCCGCSLFRRIKQFFKSNKPPTSKE